MKNSILFSIVTLTLFCLNVQADPSSAKVVTSKKV
jgi:hypothetical protein